MTRGKTETVVFFAEHIPPTLKDRFESQTWSNLWRLDISQVTWDPTRLLYLHNKTKEKPRWIKIFCVSKWPAHWSWKKLLRFDPVNAPHIRVFHHRQALRSSSPISLKLKFSHVIVWFMRRASAKAWKANGSVKHLPDPFLDPKKGFRQSRICLQKMSSAAAQSQISNLEVRELYRKDWLTNPCRSKIVSSPLYWIVVPEYQENWIHAHRDPKRMNFPQQLIVQQNLSLRCP